MTVGLKINFANYVGDYGEAEIEKKVLLHFGYDLHIFIAYHRPTDN